MDAVGLHAGDLLVHGAGDYAFERNVSVLDDDVNGRNGTQLVLAEDAVAVDGTVGSAADSVVVHGGGQDLDVVDDFSTPSMRLTTFSASDFESRERDLAEQGHGAVRVDLVGEVVEHAVVGKHHEFVTDFLVDALEALLIERASWLVVLDGGTGEAAIEKISGRARTASSDFFICLTSRKISYELGKSPKIPPMRRGKHREVAFSWVRAFAERIQVARQVGARIEPGRSKPSHHSEINSLGVLSVLRAL